MSTEIIALIGTAATLAGTLGGFILAVASNIRDDMRDFDERLREMEIRYAHLHGFVRSGDPVGHIESSTTEPRK